MAERNGNAASRDRDQLSRVRDQCSRCVLEYRHKIDTIGADHRDHAKAMGHGDDTGD